MMEKMESSDMMMDSSEMMGRGRHGMMGSDEGMVGRMMNNQRGGRFRAEDGDTVEPLKKVVQPQVTRGRKIFAFF
jgi:hypothetical protein